MGAETVRSTAINFYEGNFRAIQASPDEALIRTVTYKDLVADVSIQDPLNVDFITLANYKASLAATNKLLT